MDSPQRERLLKTPDISLKETSTIHKIEYDPEEISCGKFGSILFGTESTHKFKSPNVALKTQQIKKPKDLTDISYRELLIFRELQKLGKANLCPGFVDVYDWFKTQEKTDENRSQYMNIVLERADENLKQFITRNHGIVESKTIQSILFQILFGLYHAQKNSEFMHNDLHFKNVMLKKLRLKGSVAFSVGGKRYVSDEPFLVKITDFGLSRVSLSTGEIIFNPKTSRHFDATGDLIQIWKELKSVKVEWGENEEGKQIYKSFKKLLSKQFHVDWNEIFNHVFFKDMIQEDFINTGIVFGEIVEDVLLDTSQSGPLVIPSDSPEGTIIKSRKDRYQLRDRQKKSM